MNNQDSSLHQLGILLSGRGSNMLALADAIDDGSLPHAAITVVISDQPDAAGINQARTRGIPTRLIEKAGRKRATHDAEIVAALREHKVELICLAGYMRLLSPYFINEFRGRILNIHPSLLPAFPGLDAQQQALDYGVKFSGCTVHFVDETLDGGAIIAQAVVPVSDNDDAQTLAARILAEEHRLYAAAVRLVLSGKYEIAGRKVKYRRRDE